MFTSQNPLCPLYRSGYTPHVLKCRSWRVADIFDNSFCISPLRTPLDFGTVVYQSFHSIRFICTMTCIALQRFLRQGQTYIVFLLNLTFLIYIKSIDIHLESYKMIGIGWFLFFSQNCFTTALIFFLLLSFMNTGQVIERINANE